MRLSGRLTKSLPKTLLSRFSLAMTHTTDISHMVKHQRFHNRHPNAPLDPVHEVHAKKANRLFENDLDWGEIPVELMFDRQTQTSVLQNGLSVTTVDYLSQIVSISVFIRCGSVNEKECASGVAHFLEHMHFKGTTKRTRTQLEMELENKGAHLNAYTTRDYTSYILNVKEDSVEWGIELLSDILTNSIYDPKLIELERSTIKTELLECQKEEFETVLENSHMTAFKGHSVARPILGLVENIKSVTRDQILEYHRLNYTGENILFVATGNSDHKRLTELVNRYFGKLPNSRTTSDPELLANKKPPNFVPRVSFIHGPEGSVKVGVYWSSPNWYDKDYTAFLLLQRIIGDWEKPDFETTEKPTSLSDIKTFLTADSRIRKMKPGFVPYTTSGLFGCFIEGEPEAGPEMAALIPAYLRELRNNLRDEDVLKIRNSLLSEMMMIESGTDVTQDIGCYLSYYGRVVGKSEMAKRISLASNPEYLRKVLDKYITNKQYVLTFWGDKEAIAFGKAAIGRI